MTTTDSTSRSRTRSLRSVVAACAVLAAASATTPGLVAPADAAGSPSARSPQRAEPPAHRVVHRDARRDVLLFDLETDASRPAPRHRATDIRTTLVDHRADRLVVRARVRQLSRSGYRLMVAEVLAADDRRYDLVVDYSTRPIGPRLSLTRSRTSAEVSCPGASWSVTRSTGRIEAVIPRSCLGDPAWVRVGVGAVASPRDLTRSWADDSRARGRVDDRHLELGPRQPRA